MSDSHWTQADEGDALQEVFSAVYTGADALLEGYALCYDRDAGTAASADGSRCNVEKPATANLHNFAGLVAKGGGCPAETGRTFQIVKLVKPNGAMCNAYTDVSCTVDETELSVQNGSYALGAANDGPIVARALQTVDRSSTSGLAQVVLLGLSDGAARHSVSTFTASSRTAVQLPTAAIWNNFPLAEMRANPFLGSLFESDFRHGDGFPANHWADATYAAQAAGKTKTNGIYFGTTAVGTLVFFTTEDNSAAECQWDCPILTTGGNNWAFEVRIKCVNVTTEKGSWFVGLNEAINLAGDLQADAGATPTAANYLGFNTDAAATTALDTMYLLTGQAANEHAAAFATLAADTYLTLGLYYNGTTITQYLNGVATGTAISAVDIAAADFPAAKVLVPSVAVKGAHADDYSVTVDWIRVAQTP